MAHRKPNIAAAGIDLAFAIAAFVCGWIGSPLAGVVVAIASVAAWAWTRRASLSRMAGAQLATNVGIALLVLLAVLGAAYWLGNTLRDAT